MLYINNHQALEAILDGRRRGDGQRAASEMDIDDTNQTSPKVHTRQVRLPRLSAVLRTT